MHTTSVHNFTAISIFGCTMTKCQVRGMKSLFLKQFFAFLSAIHEYEWHFLNTETKLDKIGMFLYVFFECENFTKFHLALNFPRAEYKNGCHHPIMRPNDP